jgi:hypothetical protein
VPFVWRLSHTLFFTRPRYAICSGGGRRGLREHSYSCESHCLPVNVPEQCEHLCHTQRLPQGRFRRCTSRIRQSSMVRGLMGASRFHRTRWGRLERPLELSYKGFEQSTFKLLNRWV